MFLIGRDREKRQLENRVNSGRPEFLVVYGRRRVGKTFLIREYFNHRFAFYATGVAGKKTAEQLKTFHSSLREYGYTERRAPKDWFEAFSALRSILQSEGAQRDPVSGRLVVFLDELPWMDTARSDFRTALEYFWNSWGSANPDLLLIVCGSATSWIIEHLLMDTGGFYNRVTAQIHLKPFTLRECGELLAAGRIVMNRQQMIESYMVFGGIPYYLNAFDNRMSLAQNIEALCFREDGMLYYEYDHMFRSLFKNPERHLAIIRAIAERRSGMTRAELAKISGIGDGEPLTRALSELEQCDFLRKYHNYTKKKQGCFYQLIDPFTLFHLHFMEPRSIRSWLTYIGTPGYHAWCGNAFELVCLLHVTQIKDALGISAVQSEEYAWRSRNTTLGAQIDLLIDRRDQIINLCEMKYSSDPYTIDAAYERQLLHKLEAFREETHSKKALHLTMITANGLTRNVFSGNIISALTADDLFGR